MVPFLFFHIIHFLYILVIVIENNISKQTIKFKFRLFIKHIIYQIY